MKSAREELDSIIRFDSNEKRKHNLLAGAAIAATGIPLAIGAGKFAKVALRPKVARLVGQHLGKEAAAKVGGHGKQVADYIEAAQSSLNTGITGKLMGHALQNPKSRLGKLANFGKPERIHYASFRSGPTKALDEWAAELGGDLMDRRPEVFKTHMAAHDKVMKDITKAMETGHNETEAIRKVSINPKHADYFRRMIAQKGSFATQYAKGSAIAASVPIGVGAAVAATTRRDKSTKLSAREKLNSIIHFDISINPANAGKFTSTKKRTGKSTEELANSRNPLTRKRAQFVLNARKWHHGKAQSSGNVAGSEPGTLSSLSAREQLNLIMFADPRPRNTLGEFSGSEDGPSAEEIGRVYKQPSRIGTDLAIGAGGSAIGAGSMAGLKALLGKLKKGGSKQLSAREELDSIINFGKLDFLATEGLQGKTVAKIIGGVSAVGGFYGGWRAKKKSEPIIPGVFKGALSAGLSG